MNRIVLLATTAAALGIAARAGAAQSIEDALKSLDPNNDEHWTAGGQPRIDSVKSLTGDTSVTREALEKAMPGFTREQAASAAQGNTGGGSTDNGGTAADTGAGAPPAPPSAPEQGGDSDPMAAALADGWAKHPSADGYHYRDQDVKTDAEVAAMYNGGGQQTPGVPSAPEGPNLKADGSTGPTHDPALDISGQTGMGGAMTARSPEPVEDELRKTHVSEPSQGEPGERPIGVTQGVTDQGVNTLGTPDRTVQNAGRDIELSGEVQARSAGSVTIPSQAPAHSSSPGATLSLGGAADPAVEAAAPGGAVIAEGAPPATFFEGETVGGPFGHSGIKAASDASGQTQLAPVGDVDYAGDQDTVDALETQLADQAQKTAELREQVDNLSAQLHESLRTEAQMRRQIEANRPRSATTTTIQTFLQASQQERIERAAATQKVRDALGPEMAKQLLK